MERQDIQPQGTTPMVRWFLDPPLDGPANMARDEALLHRVGAGDSPPTLRFYRWDRPTISLGYFQAYDDYLVLPPPAGTLDVVRRQTGGGAILHDLELTYALVVPSDHSLIAGASPNILYHRVHRAFAAVLRAEGVPVEAGPEDPSTSSHRGPFFCFERHSAYDLLAAGRKIMGSAQRRTTGAVLQHGSLLLDTRHPQQHCATVAEFVEDWKVDDQLETIALAITEGKAQPATGLDPDELALAATLREKYAGDPWLKDRTRE